MKRSPSHAWLGGGALLIAAAAASLWTRAHSSTDIPPRPLETQELVRQRPLDEAPGPAVGSPLPKAPPLPAAGPATAPPRLALYEAQFQSQPRDTDAMRVEDQLLRTLLDRQLATSGITPSDPDVSCRHAVCRIVATFRSESDAAAWAALYMSVAGSELINRAQPAFVRQPDGTVQMRLFAERPTAG